MIRPGKGYNYPSYSISGLTSPDYVGIVYFIGVWFVDYVVWEGTTNYRFIQVRYVTNESRYLHCKLSSWN